LDNSSDKRNFLEVPLVNQLFNKFQTLRKIASKHTNLAYGCYRGSWNSKTRKNYGPKEICKLFD